jgi:PD-(D/E)XK endonuclease
VSEKSIAFDEPVNGINGSRARSSAVEHCVHIAGVVGSSPTAPTILDTTSKGAISELIVAAELARRGYRVSLPLTRGAPYDLIVDTGTALKRVQVKTGRIAHGVIRANLVSSKSHRARKAVSYAGRIDALIVYEPSSSLFLCFIDGSMPAFDAMVRISPAKNNQTRHVRRPEDHALDSVFPSLTG